MKSGYWLISLIVSSAFAAPEWPQFRGPGGQGVADAKGLPVTWSEGSHVRWKAAIPGRGHSSPVVNGNQIWMTTATDEGRSLMVVCVDRASGAIAQSVEVFRRQVAEKLVEPRASYACLTPVVEEGRVYVSFGPNGNACVSTETGAILWKNHDLTYHHDTKGVGSSPVVYSNLFMLNCDGMDRSFVAALNKETGKTVWITKRSKTLLLPGMSYSTPLIVPVGGRALLVSVGALRVSAYDPWTGREVWFKDVPGSSGVARPVHGNGIVYICTGAPKPELWALRINEMNPSGEPRVLWKSLRQVPLVPSPVLASQNLFWVSDGGIVCCADARTGRELWSERIGGDHFASPILAQGRLYFLDDSGRTVVMQASNKPGILATNLLDGGFLASPAVAGRALFLRTTKHLYRVEDNSD